MTRTEFLSKLNELGLSQKEFAILIGRSPQMIYRIGAENSIPSYITILIEMMQLVQATKAYLLLYDPDRPPIGRKCPNGHDLNQYLKPRNGKFVCRKCGTTIEENIYQRGQ